jgi:fibronectin type 3 domain-containing protein
MTQSLKNSHVFGVIGVCAVILLALMSQSSSPVSPTPPDTVTNAVVINPQSQLAQVTQNATITLSPANNSVAVNNTFTVAIVLNTSSQQIYGVDVNKIRFNPAMLQVVDSDSGTAGVQIAPGALMSQVFLNSVDNTAGTIQFSQVASPPSTYCCSGTLATITFRAIAAGTSNVTIDFTLNSGTDSNVAGANGDILGSVGSGTFSATAADTTAPSAPGTPALTVISSSQINLSWAASTDNVGVTGYRLERCSGSATCTSFTQIAAPTVTTYSDTGLSASTIYRYRVLAVDAAANLSAYSTAANATTQAPPDVTPPTISNVALSGVTTSGVTVTWTTNESADTQVDYGLTTGYGQSSTLNATLATTHSATVSGLSPGTSYHYRVKSRDAAGNLASSADNVFTTTAAPDTTAPNVPTGLAANPTDENDIQLSWTAPTDPAGVGQNVSGVASYQIFRGGTLLSTSPTTAFLDSGLTAGTAYSYQITAVDGAGNVSAKTTAVVATTPTFSLAVQRRIILDLEGAPATKRDVSGVVEFLNPTTLAKVYQGSITTDSLGRYTLSVPSGLIPTVTMRAVVNGYLSRLVNNVDLRNTSVIDVTFPTMFAGDFNSDKLINSLDFSVMNTKWATPDPVVDINRDGDVNSLDFSYLSRNWLQTGE